MTKEISEDAHKYETIKENPKYDIVQVNNVPAKPKKLSDEGTYDFVDTPLTDKILTPSGTSQASRINVKKGPNGQDYEYEYVYYYYDDDEEASAGGSGKNSKTYNSHDGPVTKPVTPSPSSRSTTARHPPSTEAPVPASVSSGRRGRPEYTQSTEDDDHLQSSANRADSKQR